MLSIFSPKEIFIEHSKKRKFEEIFGAGWMTSVLDDWIFTENAARDRLLAHFKSASLKGFGVEQLEQGIIASGAILHYMDITQHPNIAHITSLTRIEEDRIVRLDKFTVRNLELLSPILPKLIFKAFVQIGKLLFNLVLVHVLKNFLLEILLEAVQELLCIMLVNSIK